MANVFLKTGIVMEIMTVVPKIIQMSLTAHLPHVLMYNSAVTMVNALRTAGDVMGLMIVEMVPTS